jgi:predicted phage-related endonuclease
MKQRVTPKSRADWLDIRKGFVGASEAAALIHCHPYLTLTHLWALKAGRIDPEPENPAMRRGKLLEPVALEMLAEERPTRCREASSSSTTKAKSAQRPTRPRRRPIDPARP